MSEATNMEEILRRAEQLEMDYDWIGAAESYDKAIKMMPRHDFLKMGRLCEHWGYALYRAAMQAENQEEFKERMRRAIEIFEEARRFYERVTDKQPAWTFRCGAFVKYLGYWLTSSPSEKRKLLDGCLELEDKALDAFFEAKETVEYGKTYYELLLASQERWSLEWDRQALEHILRKGIQRGERAVEDLSKLGESIDIARANLALTACRAFFNEDHVPEPEEREKNRLRFVKSLEKTAELSERFGDTFLLGQSHLWWGAVTGGEEAASHFQKTLDCGRLTRDNFLTGWAWDLLTFTTYWKAFATEDPEKRKETAEEAMHYYDEAQHHYAIISYASSRSGVVAPPAGYAEYYWFLARSETDSGKRLELLEKAEESGIEALKEAEASDIPSVVLYVVHVVSKIFEARAYVETDRAEKRSYLEKALKYREKGNRFVDQVSPFNYWDHGVYENYLAGIKVQLADIEVNTDNRKRLFEEAVLSMEKCVELCGKMVMYVVRAGETNFLAALQGYQDTYATILTRLHDLTNDKEHLRKAIEISRKAIETADRLNMVSRMAESHWKIAKAQDFLGEHLKAAESFRHASENYAEAAGRIPQLKSFYQDHSLYMQAWTEIEKARHYHERQEYGLAKEHFKKAADLHTSLKKWSYLVSNYSAWANIEDAEDLSRKEQCEEAIQAFEQTGKLFGKTKKSIQNELDKIEDTGEKRMAESMVKATDTRQEYCQARIALEEARIFDKKGDHHSSSEKYGQAAETFEKMSRGLETDQERKEFNLFISLSRAWQKMTQAEAEASPSLYADASQLFEKAKDYSPNEQTKMLVLGHSRFCKALEEGTKFADTRDVAIHDTATKYLESASNYYVSAGFQKASEYAKATQLLFDAYAQMDCAKRESDPEKKAKLYAMAEKVLQTSAGRFMKAEHPEKRERVLRLLDSVEEERELASNLTEVLHAPPIVSSTTVFATPTPTREEAVGSERFEQADIQANMIVRKREINVGEPFRLEIELVNAGKGPALLVKVNKVIPEGFELDEKPETCRVEDSYIDMKGKRLGPLKTEELGLVLKPKAHGTFALKPTILYLDENGKYKSCEPEPISISVKELGIKGWLKGER